MQPCDRLTAKEVQVAMLVWEGQTNREIANVIGTTEQVIKNYLRNTFDKLGVWSRLELALYVAAHGGTRWRDPGALSPVAASPAAEIPHPSSLQPAQRVPAHVDPHDQKSAKSAYRSKVSSRLISA
jgi:DNA-binding CsgD family transcriptional regulator